MDATELLCAVLGDCGYDDIEPMFGDMDNDLIYDAIDMCKDNGVDLSANGIWYEAIFSAICQVFGDEYVAGFEISPNCMASTVSVYDDVKAQIEDFDEKVKEFEQLTGEPLNW